MVFLTEITRFPNYRNTRWSCPSTVGRSDYSSPDQHVESLRYCLFPLLVPGQIKNSCQNGKKDTTTCAFLFEVWTPPFSIIHEIIIVVPFTSKLLVKLILLCGLSAAQWWYNRWSRVDWWSIDLVLCGWWATILLVDGIEEVFGIVLLHSTTQTRVSCRLLQLR